MIWFFIVFVTGIQLNYHYVNPSCDEGKETLKIIEFCEFNLLKTLLLTIPFEHIDTTDHENALVKFCELLVQYIHSNMNFFVGLLNFKLFARSLSIKMLVDGLRKNYEKFDRTKLIHTTEAINTEFIVFVKILTDYYVNNHHLFFKSLFEIFDFHYLHYFRANVITKRDYMNSWEYFLQKNRHRQDEFVEAVGFSFCKYDISCGTDMIYGELSKTSRKNSIIVDLIIYCFSLFNANFTQDIFCYRAFILKMDNVFYNILCLSCFAKSNGDMCYFINKEFRKDQIYYFKEYNRTFLNIEEVFLLINETLNVCCFISTLPGCKIEDALNLYKSQRMTKKKQGYYDFLDMVLSKHGIIGNKTCCKNQCEDNYEKSSEENEIKAMDNTKAKTEDYTNIIKDMATKKSKRRAVKKTIRHNKDTNFSESNKDLNNIIIHIQEANIIDEQNDCLESSKETFVQESSYVDVRERPMEIEDNLKKTNTQQSNINFSSSINTETGISEIDISVKQKSKTSIKPTIDMEYLSDTDNFQNKIEGLLIDVSKKNTVGKAKDTKKYKIREKNKDYNKRHSNKNSYCEKTQLYENGESFNMPLNSTKNHQKMNDLSCATPKVSTCKEVLPSDILLQAPTKSTICMLYDETEPDKNNYHILYDDFPSKQSSHFVQNKRYSRQIKQITAERESQIHSNFSEIKEIEKSKYPSFSALEEKNKLFSQNEFSKKQNKQKSRQYYPSLNRDENPTHNKTVQFSNWIDNYSELTTTPKLPEIKPKTISGNYHLSTLNSTTSFKSMNKSVIKSDSSFSQFPIIGQERKYIPKESREFSNYFDVSIEGIMQNQAPDFNTFDGSHDNFVFDYHRCTFGLIWRSTTSRIFE